jgi:DNA-cytosine methyltransferase
MNVLSLFDGMSCGRIALDRLGIKVDNYYASEIDKYAMKVSEANYPDIIQVGDVTQLDTSTLPKIDLIMGGSPCQGFSVAGKGLAFDDPRSALFFEFIRCVKELKPKYFLLENVNMKKEYLNIITEYMGVEGIKINSALVSAQNRQRWYWTNITGIEQPEQRGIVLRDILEGDAEEPMYSNIYGGFGEKKPREHFDKSVTIRANSGGGSIPNVKLKDFDKNLARMTTKEGKAYALTASYNGAVAWNSMEKKQRSMIPSDKPNKIHDIPRDILKDNERQRRVYGKEGKSPSLLARSDSPKVMADKAKPNQINPSKKANGVQPYMQDRVFHVDGKSHALTREFASRTNVGEEQEVYWRKLTPVECERLQTVPDNYTNHVSNTQRYKMLGNGWTIEVIAHILKKIEIDI